MTRKGYIRIKAGPNRDRYAHRVIAEQAWQETHGEPLPRRFHVHHVDFNPAHNCRENLMILDSAIHDALDNGYVMRARYLEEPPF